MKGHELLCVEGAVRVGGDVLGRDPQGLGEAHELPALVVEACDFHDSFLAVAFDIAVEEASSQASATQEPSWSHCVQTAVGVPTHPSQ